MNRFVIAEPKRCIGCNTCMAACTQVHRQQGLQTHPRLTVERDAQGTAPSCVATVRMHRAHRYAPLTPSHNTIIPLCWMK